MRRLIVLVFAAVAALTACSPAAGPGGASAASNGPPQLVGPVDPNPQMPNLGPPAGPPMPFPQGMDPAQPRPQLPPERDIPIAGSFFMAGTAYGAVDTGDASSYGSHPVLQLLVLYANGVAVKADALGGNLAGHHQAEGFATIDVTDPATVSAGGFGHWTNQGGQVSITWNYANPETLAINGPNLDGPGEHWTPYPLANNIRLSGAFVRQMDAGIRSQGLVLRQDGTFDADGVNVVMGGEIVMPQFPAVGSGTYQIRKGSLILSYANGFTVAIAFHTDDGDTLLLNNFPYVRAQS